MFRLLKGKLSCRDFSDKTHFIKLRKSPFIPQKLAIEIKEIKFLLRNIATNINQISHRSNTLKVLVDERGLLLELKKLEEGISTYIHREVN